MDFLNKIKIFVVFVETLLQKMGHQDYPIIENRKQILSEFTNYYDIALPFVEPPNLDDFLDIIALKSDISSTGYILESYDRLNTNTKLSDENTFPGDLFEKLMNELDMEIKYDMLIVLYKWFKIDGIHDCKGVVRVPTKVFREKPLLYKSYSTISLPVQWLFCPNCKKRHSFKQGYEGFDLLPQNIIGMYFAFLNEFYTINLYTKENILQAIYYKFELENLRLVNTVNEMLGRNLPIDTWFLFEERPIDSMTKVKNLFENKQLNIKINGSICKIIDHSLDPNNW